MPKPLDYLPSFESSVVDETAVHHNIDNLIFDHEINPYYENPKEAYYGKPYRYDANLGEEEHRMSIPFNMAHYADIIEKTNLPQSLSPVIEKYLPGHGESIENHLLHKMRKGDDPGGLVAYYQPWQRGSDAASHNYAKNIGGYYKSAQDTTSPDTIKIFADAYEPGSGSTDSSVYTIRNEAPFGFIPPQTGGDKYGKWRIENKASARYGTALHEPLHGIKFPDKVGGYYKKKYLSLLEDGMKHMSHIVDPAGMKKFPGFSQSDYRKYVKEMAENLISTYGGETLRRQLNRLFKGKTEHKESVMVQDVFDDLFPDYVDPPKEYSQLPREGYQQGGPAERPPILGYMQPSVQDETAHSQMDKLMFENELNQQPQYYMSEYEEGYDPVMDFAEGMMPVGLIGKTGKGGFNLLKKLLSSNKAGKAGKQILKEGSSKIKRATKLPEKFAKVGDHYIGVAEFTDDAGNIIKQPMYKSTGTSGYGGQRAGEWMPFLGKRGGEFHKGRYALGKGGKPVSHMIDFDKYGRVMEKSLSPRMKKILPSKSKFDWEARMTGPTGPDTGRMKQLSYDIKQLENKLDDLPLSKVEFKDLNKWLSKQGVKVPERTWIPETY